MILGGVDEAGRGSVAGPLVVAGVSAGREGVKELIDLGVKDSKLLTPRQRGLLYPEILRITAYAVPAYILPREIDEYVKHGKKYRKLNYLEATYMARVIDQLGAKKVIVDAPDTNPVRFRDELLELTDRRCEVIAEHHADIRYPIVSAASIVAKVERDRAVEKLKSRYGDFGSGYPCDPKTMKFLSQWFEREGSMPDFTRKSWKSWLRILQLKL
ncbi:MAG: ribonuclease HII [Thaumarchaeota archaeon]|nr:MAG: ribonuclease HII [Nitrososphaerota archaeon]